MKPARSPRFQSAALRASIARIVLSGFSGVGCSATRAPRPAHPTAHPTATTYHVARTTRLFRFGDATTYFPSCPTQPRYGSGARADRAPTVGLCGNRSSTDRSARAGWASVWGSTCSRRARSSAPSTAPTASAATTRRESPARAGRPRTRWRTRCAARSPASRRFPIGSRSPATSNGLAAGQPAVRAALGALDARIMKLDLGPMERVNGVRYDVNRLVASYRALKPYTIQAMVTRGEDWDGASPESEATWLGLLARAEPDAVQLYSLARAPADPALQKVSRERLDEMARAIRQTLPRCVVEVF